MRNSFANKRIFFYKAISLLITAMICVTLVSCNNAMEDEAEQHGDKLSEFNCLPIRVTGCLHDGMLLEYGAKTAHGYYEIIPWDRTMLPEDHGYKGYGNIAYTDYATCQRIFLCSVPGCAHNTPECTSFVQYSGMPSLFTDYSETHLYLMARGQNGDDMRADDVGTVTEMNMDGSGRRIVCTLTAGETFKYDSALVASDEYFYQEVGHVEMIPDPNNNNIKVPVEQYVLERIWFADGRREKVFTTRNDFEASDAVLGVWNNEDLIINSYEFYDDSYALYRNRMSQNGELIERIGPESTFGYYSDQFRITGEEKDKKATVTAIDYATGEVMTIEDVPAETLLPGRVNISNRDGYKVLWHFLNENEISKEYILDFSDGTYRELTLLQKNTLEEDKIWPVADAGDSFFVMVGTEETSFTLVDLQGIPHQFSVPEYPTYALISKDDFWNCVPNYRLIDNKIK